MARVLGYGVGNTNGARDFSGKTEEEFIPVFASNIRLGLGLTFPLLAFLIPYFWRS